MDRKRSKSIEVNRKEYERLLKDANYMDVRFNPKNGGLSAIHKDHNFDPTIGLFKIARGDYERISLNVLYNYGNSVILGSEKLGRYVKASEGLLNGKHFDIKGVEGAGKNNIINNIKNANKKNVESVVLYYHEENLFSENQIRDGYQSYLRNSKSKRIKNVYYIVNGELHKLK